MRVGTLLFSVAATRVREGVLQVVCNERPWCSCSNHRVLRPREAPDASRVGSRRARLGPCRWGVAPAKRCWARRFSRSLSPLRRGEAGPDGAANEGQNVASMGASRYKKGQLRPPVIGRWFVSRRRFCPAGGEAPGSEVPGLRLLWLCLYRFSSSERSSFSRSAAHAWRVCGDGASSWPA